MLARRTILYAAFQYLIKVRGFMPEVNAVDVVGRYSMLIRKVKEVV